MYLTLNKAYDFFSYNFFPKPLSFHEEFSGCYYERTRSWVIR